MPLYLIQCFLPSTLHEKQKDRCKHPVPIYYSWIFGVQVDFYRIVTLLRASKSLFYNFSMRKATWFHLSTYYEKYQMKIRRNCHTREKSTTPFSGQYFPNIANNWNLTNILIYVCAKSQFVSWVSCFHNLQSGAWLLWVWEPISNAELTAYNIIKQAQGQPQIRAHFCVDYQPLKLKCFQLKRPSPSILLCRQL